MQFDQAKLQHLEISETGMSDDPNVGPSTDPYWTKGQSERTWVDFNCSSNVQGDLHCDVWYYKSNGLLSQ